MRKQRIVWIDYVKVICIFLMVACHVGENKFFNPTWVYQFHMPAFFVVSGLLFRPKPMLQTLKAFAIPVLFCSVLNLSFRLLPEVYHLFKGTVGLDEWEGIVLQLNNYAESFLMYRDGKLDAELFPGIWFVVSLLVIRLLFSVKYVLKHSFLIGITCVLYMGLSSFIDTSVVVDYHIYKVLGAIPFFVLGFLMGKDDVKLEKLLTTPFEMKIVLFVIFVIICSIQGFCSMGECRYGHNYILYFVNALIGTYLLICVCRLLPERKYIVLLSTGTFLILGLHRTLSAINVMILFNPIGINAEEYALLNALLIIVWLYWPIKILLKHKPVLLGK